MLLIIKLLIIYIGSFGIQGPSRSISRSEQIVQETFYPRKKYKCRKIAATLETICILRKDVISCECDLRRNHFALCAPFLAVTLEFSRSFTSLLSLSDILFIIRSVSHFHLLSVVFALHSHDNELTLTRNGITTICSHL